LSNKKKKNLGKTTTTRRCVVRELAVLRGLDMFFIKATLIERDLRPG